MSFRLLSPNTLLLSIPVSEAVTTTILPAASSPTRDVFPISQPDGSDKMSGLATKQQSLKIFEKLKSKAANKVGLSLHPPPPQNCQ